MYHEFNNTTQTYIMFFSELLSRTFVYISQNMTSDEKSCKIVEKDNDDSNDNDGDDDSDDENDNNNSDDDDDDIGREAKTTTRARSGTATPTARDEQTRNELPPSVSSSWKERVEGG